uniref:Ig-like domain-containing protein n=1 Tax=Electrophorus electricus TaxID=8005 RepID=A0A4W4FJZ4_ELEEL
VCACASLVSYHVTVPEEQVVAVRGSSVVLGCEFTPDPEAAPNFPDLVVNWQRVEDSQVVHSFYYGQDQLERQGRAYWNRTALFISELGRGNASLQIGPVDPGDVGRYFCVVSTKDGTDRAELQLNYAAFYTEPQLSIDVNSSSMTVRYKAEGFPKPEVRWVGAQGEDLQHHEELSCREAGLCHLTSSYMAETHSLNVTFMLKNQLLKQDLKRPVNVSYTDGNGSFHFLVKVTATLAVFCTVLCIAVLVACWQHCRK